MRLEGKRMKSDHYRRFLISAENLSHFDCGLINIRSCKTLEEISIVAKHTLLTHLIDSNLVSLYEQNLHKNFHIHDRSIRDIERNRNEVFYVCACRDDEDDENVSNR